MISLDRIAIGLMIVMALAALRLVWTTFTVTKEERQEYLNYRAKKENNNRKGE